MDTAVKKGLSRKKYILHKGHKNVLENGEISTEEWRCQGKSEIQQKFCIQNIKYNGHNIGHK